MAARPPSSAATARAPLAGAAARPTSAINLGAARERSMATAAAAIMARARREVENKFFDNDAFSADRAVEIEPRVPVQQRFLDQLMAQNIVHQVGSNRYWLDLKAYEKMRRARMI